MKSIRNRSFLISTCVIIAAGAKAQYTTPNTGTAYTLDDLVTLSEGVFTAPTETSFLQIDDFTLAENDTLLIDSDLTWLIADSALVTIEGTFTSEPPTEAVITAAVEDLHYKGIRLEESSHVHLQRTSLTYGGGIKAMSTDLIIEHCLISNHAPKAATGGALDLSRGKIIIDNVEFRNNERAAISSGANISVAPQITNCTFHHNGTSNSNRPQINLGPSGEDTTLIRNNVVIGNRDHTKVGGIAFSSLLGVEGHVVIDSNEVVDNRYGITVTGGNVTSVVAYNIITDNDTEGNPALGGSGINLNGNATNVSMVTGNEISGHLWGITLQNAVTTNLGDTAAATFNPGLNAFANNGNSGVIYALYNNTANTVPAMNNCWDFEQPMTDSIQVADVIVDVADDASLGEVLFMPFWDCDAIGTSIDGPTGPNNPLLIHPNPSAGPLSITSTVPVVSYAIHNPNGQLVRSINQPNTDRWTIDGLGAGLYLLRAITADGVVHTERFVIN